MSSILAASFGEDEEPAVGRFVEGWRVVAEKHGVDSDMPSYLSLLTEEEAELLAEYSRRMEFRPNSTVYFQGDVGVYLGFVLSGSLTATTTGASDGERWQWTLSQGDTFGEYALVIDGQIGDGKREATLTVQDQPAALETISFHKFASFLEQLPAPRSAKLRDQMVHMVTGTLYPELSGSLPDSQADDLILHPWRARNPPVQNLGARVDNGGRRPSVEHSVAGTMISEGTMLSKDPNQTHQTPKRDKARIVVIDDPPVTFLNTDSFLECFWMNKKTDNIITNTTRAIVDDEILIPDTAVYRDGELIAWYFGSCSELKRKSKEKLTSWSLIEKMCKDIESSHNQSQIVATLTCSKGGKAMGSTNVQYRLLDKRKLESVIGGAKANKLSAVIQKYVRSSKSKMEKDYILQCLWSDHSFAADWISESMLECFTQVHKPNRIMRTKKLRTQMQIKYHSYVAGNLSNFGDHLKPKKLINKPNAKGKGQKQISYVHAAEDKDDLTGRTVPRQVREVVKVACQQISSIMATHVNGSGCAHETAVRSADLYNSGHNLMFTNVETMCCFFKISKQGGAPILIHSSAAFGHPDTVEKIQSRTRAELLDPKESTFNKFANANVGVSMLGERAHTMDFTETLKLLIDLELLYKQVSVTEVSHCFQQACLVRNVEDGQLTFDNYRTLMANLAVLLGEADPPSQHSILTSSDADSPSLLDRSVSGNIQGKHLSVRVSRNISGVVTRNASLDDTPQDAVNASSVAGENVGGWASFEKQRDLQRTRLGRLFASTIVYARRTEDVEKRAHEREQKNSKVTEERRRRVQAQLRAEAEAAAERVKRARVKADLSLQQQADAARKRWDHIEDRAAAVMAQRRQETEERALAAEERRQARKQQLQQMKMVEEHRLTELSKKAALLEEHRREVYTKRQQERENSRIRLSRIGREKEVVSELFQEYVRTGALHRPWGLIDLEGDALPAVLEIAADKSRRGPQKEDPKALLFPIVDKGGNRFQGATKGGPRSKSSMM